MGSRGTEELNYYLFIFYVCYFVNTVNTGLSVLNLHFIFHSLLLLFLFFLNITFSICYFVNTVNIYGIFLNKNVIKILMASFYQYNWCFLSFEYMVNYKADISGLRLFRKVQGYFVCIHLDMEEVYRK